MIRLATFNISVLVLAAAAVLPWAGRPALVQRHEVLMTGSVPSHVAVVGDSYTAGSDQGGRGSQGWTEQAWQLLRGRGTPVAADVASEGGAGYAVRGNHGSVFQDLAARAVHPDDALVVFFGSRNDQDVNPAQLTAMSRDTLGLARWIAPSAKLLVIGPPWPTAEVPDTVLRIRDILGAEAGAVGAQFVDPIADGWFVGRLDLIGSDGVHPTDAGHAYLADKIVPLIGNLLPKPA